MKPWDDLSQFLDTDEFADSSVIHMGAVHRPVNGIFDQETDITGSDDAFSAPATILTFMCKETDLQNVQRGDTITIGATTYDILGPAEPDGTGFAVLRLAPQSPSL